MEGKPLSTPEVRNKDGAIEHASLVAAVEQAADAFLITDTGGTIQYVNPAFTAMTGYSSEEAVGQNPRFLKSGRNPASFYEQLWNTILSGKVWRGEPTNRRKDGTFYDEEMRIAPVRDAQGAVSGYVAIKHDVTAQRAQEAAHSFLATIVENSEDAIVSSTPEGIIVTWNLGASKLFGCSAEDAVGKHVSMLVAPGQLDDLKYFIGQVSQGIAVSQYESLCRRNDGSTFQVSVTGTPIRNSAGEVTAMSAVIRDISARREVEKKLCASEERFREVFEYAPVGICVTGPDERFIQANAEFCRMTGYSEEELRSKNWTEFCHPGDLAAALERRDSLWKGGASSTEGKRRYISRDGRVIWCQVRISLVRSADGSPHCSVTHVEDISERRHAEEALRESEERFRTMADSCPSVLWVTGVDGEVGFINREYREFCGVTCEQVQCGKWHQLIHPADAPAFVDTFRRAIREHASFSAESRIRRADGEWRLVGTNAEPRLSPAGEYMGHIGLSADITERRRAEEALRESEERFRTVFENAPSGVCVTGLDGRYMQVNAAFCRMMGYTAQELLGKLWSDLTHPDDLGSSLQTRDEVSRDLGGWKEAEKRYVHRSGATVWVHIKIALVPDSAGVPLWHVAHVEDITERKQAQQTLLESEHRFRVMADSCPIAIWVGDAKGRIRFANRTYLNFCGITSEELDPDAWRSLVHPDDAPQFLQALERTLNEHTRFNAEWRGRRADGVWRWIESHAVPRFSAQGEFLGLVGTSADITERKQAEQALQISEEKFRQLAENIHEVFWMMSPSADEVLYVSPAYEQVWGRTCESLYQRPMSWTESVHPDDQAHAHAMFARQTQGEAIDSEYRILTSDGQEKWIRDRAFPVRDASGQMIRVAGIAEEFTAQKHYQEELIRAREDAEAANEMLSAEHAILDGERKLLRAFIDNVPDLMFVKDTEGRFVVANPELAKLSGAEKPEAMLGKTDFDFYPHEIAAGFREEDQRVILSTLPVFDREETFRASATDELCYMLTTKVPLFDRHGHVTGVAGIGRNITQRIRAEIALRDSNLQLQETTARAKELALDANAANRAKSRFLANMSHEIRTPMNGVIGMNQLLLETSLTPEQRRFAEVAQTSGRTLLALIDDILDLSKIEAGKIALENLLFDLGQTVDELVLPLRVHAEAKGLVIYSRVSSKIPRLLRGDAHRLRQVLTNLSANAIKFTARGGITLNAELENLCGCAATVRFTVTDTGIGIGAEQIAVLFSPFVQADASTTRKYGGTGLGLAISKQLVEMMGGSIGVNSREGQGSSFWFTAVFECEAAAERQTAPRPDNALQNEFAHAHARPARPGNGETILVAEDNSTNRELILAQLEKLGYKSHAVADGAKAVEAVLRGGFDLVLMDCQMPEMDGYEATRRIRQSIQARIPIVALTASAMTSDRERCLGEGMDDYLAKPVELALLAQVLARWISASSPAKTSQPLHQPSAKTEATVFDVDSLLRRLLDDRKLARATVNAFLDDAPSQLEQLRVRLDQSDAPGIRLQAHTLKGAAGTVGAKTLCTVALAIETAAGNDRIDPCRSLLERAIEEFERFKIGVAHQRWISAVNGDASADEANEVQAGLQVGCLPFRRES
jgi:PAS domain S-box-containing protein